MYLQWKIQYCEACQVQVNQRATCPEGVSGQHHGGPVLQGAVYRGEDEAQEPALLLHWAAAAAIHGHLYGIVRFYY